MDDVRDVIEAFADGEAVDPKALKAALADADGRDHLIDVLVLRGLVGGQHAWRRPAIAASAALHEVGARLTWRRWLPAAAAVVLVSVLVGFLAGARLNAPGQSTTPSTTSAPAAAQAPAPTQVIQLKNGVDWNEKAGGR